MPNVSQFPTYLSPKLRQTLTLTNVCCRPDSQANERNLQLNEFSIDSFSQADLWAWDPDEVWNT